jgi:hypothetical protein
MSEKSWNQRVRALLLEAGKAVNEKTRDIRSPDVPDFVVTVANAVGSNFVEARSQSVSAANLIASLIGPGLLNVRGVATRSFRTAGEGVGRSASALNERLEVFRTWFVPTSMLKRSEKEALIQDALRKHDAILRELHEKNAASQERVNYLKSVVIQLTAVIAGLKPDIDSKNEILTVLADHEWRIKAETEAGNLIDSDSDASIETVKAVIVGLLDRNATTRSPQVDVRPPHLTLRSWDTILAKAQTECISVPTFNDILSPEEQAITKQRLVSLRQEFAGLHELRSFDYAVAGTAGILAALADIFLVAVPRHPGFLGGTSSEGGWLSNLMKDKFAHLLPKETINALERAYPVPYDASTNSILSEPVPGLGPRSHRLHSVGHDPILGWIFGVSDILAGQFTAISNDGSVIVQSAAPGGNGAEEVGINIIARIIDAFRRVGGHMLSDVATPAGLPPPLFVLSQFIQSGEIGGHNVADIARAMYRSGYDFRHFLAGGLCAALTELIVRLAWTARELGRGNSLAEATPLASKPRLRSSLLLAHGVAAAINAGKVAITQNPLALNWAQWLALFRYLLPQMHWLLVEKQNQRKAFIQQRLDMSWSQFNSELSETWRMTFGDEPIAVL